MQSNLLNMELEGNYREALNDIGYDLVKISKFLKPFQNKLYDEEIGVDLGYGSIGRIAACSMDSLATLGIPCWAYGLRYDYGIFR